MNQPPSPPLRHSLWRIWCACVLLWFLCFSNSSHAETLSQLASDITSSRYASRFVASVAVPTTSYTGTVGVTVVKPRNYDPNRAGGYNVVYAFDGSWVYDTDAFDWVSVADELEDAGLIDPVILVGIATPSGAASRDIFLGPDADKARLTLVNNVIPYIDANYKTNATASGRCVAGHSLGGHAALFTAWHSYSTVGRVIACSPSVWASYAWVAYYHNSQYADMRNWAMNDSARKAGLRMFLECGGSENAFKSWSPQNNGYTQVDQAADTAKLANNALNAGWVFGDNLGYYNNSNYSYQLTVHSEVKPMSAGRSGLAMVFRKAPLSVTSVEMFPMQINGTAKNWTDGKSVLPGRMDILATEDLWNAEILVNFGPYIRMTLPDWSGMTSSNTAAATIANLNCPTTLNTSTFDTFGLITAVANGTSYIETSATILGTSYSPKLAVNIGNPGSPLSGVVAGSRGGSNQNPQSRFSTWVVPILDAPFTGTLPGYDPDGDTLTYLPVFSFGGRKGRDATDSTSPYEVTAYPGNLVITGGTTGNFTVYPTGATGRIPYQYVTRDGGLEAINHAFFYFGAPKIGLNATTASFSMTQGVAAGVSPASVPITVSNTGSDAMPSPSVTGIPSWLDAQISGSSAPYTLTLSLNSSQANSLNTGNYSGTLTVSPGKKLVLLPEADTTHETTTNFGKNKKRLGINLTTEEMMLRFDLAALPGPVKKAVLRVRGKFLDAFSVRMLADDSWNETTVNSTYSLVDGGALGTISALGTTEGWGEIDVTSFMEAQRSGDGKMSVYLYPNGTQANLVYLREDEEWSPEVIVFCDAPTDASLTQTIAVSLEVASATPTIATTTLPAGTAGLSYSASLVSSGGTGTKSWSITSGSLPPGLTLNSSTGEISGTPTAAGTAELTVRVTDSAVPTPLSAQTSLTLVIAPATSANVSDSGLVCHLKLDESSGTTAANFANNTKNATVTDANGSQWSPTGGIMGGAFDASAESTRAYLNLGSASTYPVGKNDPYTVSLWFKTASTGTEGPLFAMAADATSNRETYIYHSNGAIKVQSGKSVATAYGSTLNNGAWHHLVMVNKPTAAGGDGKYYVYIDGSLSGSLAIGASANAVPLNITSGTRWTATDMAATTGDYDGLIDDLRIYTRWLDASEISELHSGTNSRPVVSIASPANGASFSLGDSISFSGTATDAESGNLTASASWTSSIDGALGTGGAITKTNLTSGTHIITLSATDGGGASASSFIVVTVEAADATPPNWVSPYPIVEKISHAQLDVVGKINETGKFYSVVVPDGATAPTAANVRAGVASGGAAAVSAANSAAAGSVATSVTLTGLSPSTAYDVYVLAEDDTTPTPNPQTTPVKIDATTLALDITAPANTPGFPKIENALSDRMEVVYKSPEAGSAFFVVLPSGATAPSSAQVLAGTDASGSPALASGNAETASNWECILPVSGLSPNTAYDVFVVGKDLHYPPNAQPSPTKISVSTRALTHPRNIAHLGSSVCSGVGAATYEPTIEPRTAGTYNHTTGSLDDHLRTWLMGYTYRSRELLSARGWTVRNRGVYGDDTTNAFDRFTTDLLPGGDGTTTNNVSFGYALLGLGMNNDALKGGMDAGLPYYNFANGAGSGILNLIDLCKTNGIRVVLGSCYVHETHDSLQYATNRRMNLFLNTLDVPVVNFLGAVDNGNGRWATGFNTDDGHPNLEGHREFFHAVVPSVYEALEMGKTVPQLQNAPAFLRLSSAGNSPLYFSPENDWHASLPSPDLAQKIHSFALRLRVRTTSDGSVAAIRASDKNNADATVYPTVEISGGKILYRTPTGGGKTIDSTVNGNDGSWHDVVVSHYYASSRTLLFVDGQLAGSLSERLAPTRFTFGGPDGASTPAPASADYQDLMVWRSALNADEARWLYDGKMFHASLELYAPLDDPSFAYGSPVRNLAQSTSRLWLNTASFTASNLASSAPNNLVASDGGSQINLGWSDRSGGTASFRIERRTLPRSGDAKDLIMDSSSASFDGSWSTKTNANSYGGTDQFATSVTGTATASATYSPDLTGAAGTYAIYTYHRPYASVGADYKWTLSDGIGGTTDLWHNYYVPAGKWVYAGEFALSPGASIKIENTYTLADKEIIADAIRFVRVLAPGEWSTLANLPPGQTAYSDSSVSPQTAYEYRVSAVVGGRVERSSETAVARASFHYSAPLNPLNPQAGTGILIDSASTENLTANSVSILVSAHNIASDVAVTVSAYPDSRSAAYSSPTQNTGTGKTTRFDSISGLSPSTTYYYTVFVNGTPEWSLNDANNGSYSYTGSFTTLASADATAPSWSSSYPSVSDVGSASASVRLKINENGTAYFVLLPTGSPAPTSAQVRSGSVTGKILSSSVSLSANSEASASLSALTPATAYTLYSVAEDTSSNLQTTPAASSFSTLSLRDAWRLSHFGTTTNTGDAADTSDPDSDGVKNIVEFALGMNPQTNDISHLPSLSLSGSNLILEWRKNKSASALSFQVEQSTSLSGAWSPSSGGSFVSDIDPATELWRATVPISNPTTFLRLKITY